MYHDKHKDTITLLPSTQGLYLLYCFTAILLLDEPTTGLDSYTARHLVKNLAELAHSGKMVILSIHQPRYDIFGLLDKVALLSAGSMVYYGGAHQMVDYFTLAGYPCPRFANPLDHYGRSLLLYQRKVVMGRRFTTCCNY